MKEYEFKPITSSPYFPQANGEAERAVGTIKNLLKKSNDPYRALLAYRTTPLQVGYSPAQLLMGRVLRSMVPTTKSQRKACVPDPNQVRERNKRNKARQKQDFDSHHGARELSSLLPGGQVWLSERECEGRVQEEVAPRSYTVESEGSSVHRNRRDLIRLPNSETTESNGQSTSDGDNPNANDQEQPNVSDDSSTHLEVRRSNRTSRPPDQLDSSWSK